MSNRKFFRSLSVASITTLTAMLAAPFIAQAATSLPNGASSLTETYDSWTVSCNVQAQGDAKKVICSMTQQQVDERRQRALAAEFSPNKDGIGGALVLPFGLNLTSGAILQLDENPPEQPIAFSTCMPGGCILPINFNASQTDAIAKGKALAVTTQALGGNDIKLNVPLDGFSAALKRTRELTK